MTMPAVIRGLINQPTTSRLKRSIATPGKDSRCGEVAFVRKSKPESSTRRSTSGKPGTTGDVLTPSRFARGDQPRGAETRRPAQDPQARNKRENARRKRQRRDVARQRAARIQTRHPDHPPQGCGARRQAGLQRPGEGDRDQAPAATGERHGVSEPGVHQVVHRGFRLLRLRPHPDEAPARRFRQFPKIYF